MLALSLCGTVVSLQQTLVLPMLPDFPALLGTTAENASWLVTATLLSGALATASISRLADMFGKKRMLVITLGITVLGSLLGSVSGTLAWTLVARVLQGVGMALVPVGIAIMRDELPRHRVPLGVALMSATLAIGAGVGLPVSGLIAEYLDWHAIFWLTGAVGAVMLVVALRVLSESPVRTGGSFDYGGAIVLSAALTAGLLALSKGGQWGWSSPLTLLLGGTGVLLLVVFVPLETRVRNPLIDVRVTARPAVLFVNVAAVLAGFAMFTNMLITTQLLQLPTSSGTGLGLGLDMLRTGLWMAPTALAFGAMAPVSAAVTRRWGAQTTLLVGALVMAFSYVARVFLSTDLWQVVTGSVVVSAGTALVYAAMPTLVMRAVPVTETASANGLNTLLRSVGTSAASAAVAAVTAMGVVRVGDQVFPSAHSLMLVFWASSAAALVVAMLALPMFGMRDYAEHSRESVGHLGDVLVHGRVMSAGGAPVGHAVVTFLTPTGQQVDWGTVDPDGEFTVAVPRLGRYVMVAAADGWHPQSRTVEVSGDGDTGSTVLVDLLTLSGTAHDAAGSVAGAVVVLTRQGGDVVDRAWTDASGRYEFLLPVNGQYVLTALLPNGATSARAVTVWSGALTIDLVVEERGAESSDEEARQEVVR
ncbi:MFS transporter [Georgenia sp. SYP-B2076]|uniref:MFS transporter n=1 Tax=Georgenia sp. SYP-B2076 TaxID=2495881 RepID=UPI00197A8DA5|nr:MFS transporter [Georgenia sp. SYP-B2076]